jgi:N-acetylated-alpha-linked acidic dipeptidase
VRAVGPEDRTVLAAWLARKDTADPALADQPKFGDLGGGSDHVAFWCRAGVPSAGMSGGGTPGTPYHSVYDTLKWYRAHVGDDYQPARMVTQVTLAALARLADDPVPPLDHARDMHDMAIRLDELAVLADARLPDAAAPIRDLARRARHAAVSPTLWTRASIQHKVTIPARAGRPVWAAVRDRVLSPKGLPGREWYRNELASPDADSGYAAWLLPRLTRAIDQRDLVPARVAIERYGDLIGPEAPPTTKPGSNLPTRPAKP